MLKSIEIAGFKSFAKKSTLLFGSPISAIVGPNGSGKSNTTEAFRFVLGEQSKKRMRTQKSEDLLWIGNDAVSRANRARVAITFDNRPGASGKRLLDIDFDEVVIERSVFRDGENEYLINGSKVRLKDVSALLAGANIGASGHHIISQGEADRILGATARERKEMLEEALGLNVYKYKKVESERKLEKTLENIKDAESLKRELTPHLAFLERQMKKLERSRELATTLAADYARYIAAEKIYIQKESARIEQAEKEPKEALAEVSAKIEALRTQLQSGSSASAEEQALGKADERVSALLTKKGELERELGRLEGQMSFAKEQMRKRAQEEPQSVAVATVRDFVRELESEVSGAGEDANALKQTLANISHAIERFVAGALRSGASTQDDSVAESMREIEAEMAAKQREIDTFTQELKSEKEQQHAAREALRKKSEAEGDRAQVLYELKTKEDELQNLLRELSRARDALEFTQRDLSRVEEEARMGGFAQSTEAGEARSREEQRELLKEIERTHARLEEAGGVDEDTVDEHKEVAERVAFLESEIADLKHSREQLLELIADLDEEMVERFEVGLAKIDTEFNKFFALLFDGGDAHIKTVQIKARARAQSEEEEGSVGEEEEEVFESGIEVAVKLPRKKVTSLDVLSGGERALTSIALIFAMSQVNPPPFIILDETDAALDEANSRRYADMVRALSKHSQLILVTHNRRTMEAAGELYGVTMSGDGVSKLLSVKFDEAVKVAK